jgi:hypothetical protein
MHGTPDLHKVLRGLKALGKRQGSMTGKPNFKLLCCLPSLKATVKLR